MEYIGEGNKVTKVLSMVDISRSTFYYRAVTGRKGRKPEKYVMQEGANCFRSKL